MIDVVCFYRPRSPAPEFCSPKQYKQMLENCRQSAFKHGYSFHHLEGSRPAATCWLKTAVWNEWAQKATRPWILIDPDCEIVKPVDELFERNFDVALTRQNDPRHPYNAGVLFCKPSARTQQFFHTILAIAGQCSPNSQVWGADQDALVYYMQEPQLDIKVIELASRPGMEGNIWNFTPETRGRAKSIPDDVYIVHWRGRRKKWRK